MHIYIYIYVYCFFVYLGTGSCGATIRMYFELIEKKEENLLKAPQEVLKDLIKYALAFCKIKEYVGTDIPTVIT